MSSFADKTFNDVSTSFSDLYLSEILGYYEYEEEWYTWEIGTVNDSDAIVLTPADGIMTKVANVQLNNIGGIENELKSVQIGELLGYKPVKDEDGNVLYWNTAAEGEEPVKATGITASLADLTVNELSTGDKLQQTINDITIADVMGYTEVDGKWTTKDGEEITGVMAVLAGSKVGELSSDINTIEIGEMLGYKAVTRIELDSEGNEVEVIDHWVDKNGVKVTGVMAAFADLSINEMSEGDAVQNAIQDIKVADVLGLKYDENAKVWYDDKDGDGQYDDGEKATGVMAALAETSVGNISSSMDSLTIGEMLGYTPVYVKDYDGNNTDVVDYWTDSSDQKVTGVIGALASTSVKELNTRLNDITVGEVLGYAYDEATDTWYEDINENGVYDAGERASGVTGALAGTKLNGLNGALSNLQIGEVAGYVKHVDDPATPGVDESGWYTEDGKPASGILGALADLTVDGVTNEDNLSNAIQNITLADALGYTKGNDGKWYNGNAEVSGVLAVLAGNKITELDTAINDAKLGEILGYTAVDENGDGEAEYWQTKNSSGETVMVTGFMTLIADSTISNVGADMDKKLKSTSMQFFMNEGLISFGNGTDTILDTLSTGTKMVDVPNDGVDYHVDEHIGWGGKVPEWRTKPLSEVFSYIVSMLVPSGI